MHRRRIAGTIPWKKNEVIIVSHQLPSDVWVKVEAFLATGEYASEADVVRDALMALEKRHEDLAAIREGYEDMEAGRYQSLAECDAELRKKHTFLNDE